MSIEYNQYIIEHKAAVVKGWVWMKENLLEKLKDYVQQTYPNTGEEDIGSYFPLLPMADVDYLIQHHDESKYNPDEYYPYDAYFYGGNKSHAVVENFHKAFLLHMHRNPHHWQFWVLTSDNAGEPERLIEMPLNYIFEMICDWWSFSWRKDDLTEIFKWWDEHKDHIHLHKRSRATVEKILGEMKKILMPEETEALTSTKDDIPTVELAHAEEEIEENPKKFGVPEIKKYPMPDADHVRSAIRFFNYISPEYEKELADAILERAKEYGVDLNDMDIGDENKFKKYVPKEEGKDE